MTIKNLQKSKETREQWLKKILDPSNNCYNLRAFVYNLFGITLFLPFINQFAHFLESWIKEDEQYIERYIQNVPENITDAALEALAKEARHLLYMVIYLNLRFLRIPATIVDSSEFTMSGDFNSLSKQDHYISIKKLEGKIVSYALKIKLEDSEQGYDREKAEEISVKVNNLISAVRSGVYSAKSLKNINENLVFFHLTDNDIISNYYTELKIPARSIYTSILNLLSEIDRSQLVDEELSLLKEKSYEFHHELSDRIYKKTSGTNLSSLDLSTLLNVNKEIQTSEKALIKALMLIFSH